LGKLIFLVLAIVIVWVVLKNLAKARRRDQPPRPPAAEDMVRCTHCGVHLPRSESLLTQGVYFCSAEHRRQHESGRDAR